jgi:tetratricopeptide (TPR) repeat protein
MEEFNQPNGARLNVWWRVIGPVFLFILVAALYAPSLNNDFIYDDGELILQQVTPHSIGDVLRVFEERHWYNLPYYRPMARLTMVVQKFLHGNNPGPYHLFNAALMGLAALLGYGLLRLPVFGVRPVLAMFGAALFGMHPIASVCVYPICSGRETLMPVIFIIAAVYCFLRDGRVWYTMALLMFSISLLCKELSVIVPGLFVLSDVLGLSINAPGRSLREWLWRYAPVGVILAVYFLIRWKLFGGGGEYHVAVLEYPSGPVLSLLYTLQTTFVPFAQLVYEPRVEVWWSAWRIVVSLFIVSLLAVVAIRYWPTVKTRVFFWLGWFFLSLMPMANLLAQEARFAERYGSLALVGVIGIIGTLVSKLWERTIARRIMTGVGIAVLAACATISFHRGGYFQSDLAFLTQWLITDPKSGQAHLSLGEYYLEQGSLDKATLHVSRALRAHPDWDKALNIMGSLFVRQHNTDQAVFHLERALRSNPNFAEAHINLANAYGIEGKLEDAISHYSEALRLNPDSVEAHVNLGLALARAGRKEDAISHYSEALRINPDSTEACLNLGNALAGKGKFDDAIWYYSEALRIDPDFGKAQLHLGIALAVKGKFEEAIKHYSEALRIKPDFLEAHYNLGIALVSEGKLEEAARHYSEVLRINPEFVGAHFELGNILAVQGNADEAIKQYSEALRINRDFSGAHMNLGNALFARGKFEEAMGHYSEVLRINPDYADARDNLEKAVAAKRKFDAAYTEIQRAMKVTPENATLHYNLGNLFISAGKLDAAIDQYEEALSIQPTFLEALNNLGLAHTKKCEYDKALSVFEKMTELQPDSAGAYYNIACIYAKQNKVVESIGWLKKAIKRGYNNWHLIKTDKDLESIRDSSYYKEIVNGSQTAIMNK